MRVSAVSLAHAAVEAINSGDTARIRRFVHHRVDGDAAAGAFNLLAKIYRQSGGVTVRDSEAIGSRGVGLRLWASSLDRGILLYVSPDSGGGARRAPGQSSCRSRAPVPEWPLY